MFDIFKADYLARLEIIHNEFKAALKDISPEGLDWVPLPNTNSLTVLILHTMGAERYWIGMGDGQPEARDRASEFASLGQDSGHDEASLHAILDAALAYAREKFEQLTPESLSAEYPSPAHGGRIVRGMDGLLHAMEHSGVHLGHAQLNRDFWLARSAEGEG